MPGHIAMGRKGIPLIIGAKTNPAVCKPGTLWSEGVRADCRRLIAAEAWQEAGQAQHRSSSTVTSTTPPWSVKMSLACREPTPLVVPVMSHRQICASSEPDRRCPSRKGLHARPYLRHAVRFQNPSPGLRAQDQAHNDIHLPCTMWPGRVCMSTSLQKAMPPLNSAGPAAQKRAWDRSAPRICACADLGLNSYPPTHGRPCSALTWRKQQE